MIKHKILLFEKCIKNVFKILKKYYENSIPNTVFGTQTKSDK